MRVRVPATRDMAELYLAQSVKGTMDELVEAGRIPPPPEELKPHMDKLLVSVDPHMSIHAMIPITHGFGRVVDRLGFGVVQNMTTRSFLTSDNPVIYFDPDKEERAAAPYDVDINKGNIELLFPIAPDLIIVGRTEWKEQFSKVGIRYFALSDNQEIGRLNRLIAKYGYRFVFAQKEGHEALISKYADLSPVLNTMTNKTGTGTLRKFAAVFGPRPKKPKWHRPPNQTFSDKSPFF